MGKFAKYALGFVKELGLGFSSAEADSVAYSHAYQADCGAEKSACFLCERPNVIVRKGDSSVRDLVLTPRDVADFSSTRHTPAKVLVAPTMISQPPAGKATRCTARTTQTAVSQTPRDLRASGLMTPPAVWDICYTTNNCFQFTPVIPVGKKACPPNAIPYSATKAGTSV